MRLRAMPFSFSLSVLSLPGLIPPKTRSSSISEELQRARQRRLAACLAGARRRRRAPVTALVRRRRIESW